MGSVANMVIQPWGALLIGFLAGFISVVRYKFISLSTFEINVQPVAHTKWLDVAQKHMLRSVKTVRCMAVVAQEFGHWQIKSWAMVLGNL